MFSSASMIVRLKHNNMKSLEEAANQARGGLLTQQGNRWICTGKVEVIEAVHIISNLMLAISAGYYVMQDRIRRAVDALSEQNLAKIKFT